MKTAIFVTDRFLKFYDITLLRLSYKLRLVLITSQDAKTPEGLYALFDKVFFITKDIDFPGSLNYLSLSNIVHDERSQNKKLYLICNDDVNMKNVAKLRDEYDLPNIRSNHMCFFYDKLAMKDQLQSCGIRIPQYEPIVHDRCLSHSEGYYNDLTEKYGTPFVAKPFNAASSKGLHIINSWQDFNRLLQGNIALQNYEFEEYICGDLYHCDSVCQDGKFLFQTVSKYNRPMGDFLDGYMISSITMPYDHEKVHQIKQFTQHVLESFGRPNGVSHMEIFYSKDQLIFLEVAARAPGGLAIDSYEQQYGINLVMIDFEIQLGLLKAEKRIYSQTCFAAWALFPMRSGEVEKLCIPKLISQHKIHWHVKVGDELRSSNNLSETVAAILLWNENYEQLESDLDLLSKTELVHYQELVFSN